MADAAPTAAAATARCEYPRCICGDDPAPTRCPFPDCDGVLHHCCFTAFCDRHSIPDPPGTVDRYCWTCVTEMLADDDAMYRSAVEAEEAVHTPPAVTAVPPPTEAVPAEAASEAWEEILPADSTREASLDPTPVQHASTPALFGEDGEQTATPPPSVAASSPARAAAPSVAASSPARAAAPLPPFPLAGDRISIGGERGVVIQANIKIPSQLAVVYDRQPLGWHLIDLLSPNMPRFGPELR